MDSGRIQNITVSPFYMGERKINITKYHVIFIIKYLKAAKAWIFTEIGGWGKPLPIDYPDSSVFICWLYLVKNSSFKTYVL